jgi:hypothetical protein
MPTDYSKDKEQPSRVFKLSKIKYLKEKTLANMLHEQLHSKQSKIDNQSKNGKIGLEHSLFYNLLGSDDFTSKSILNFVS